MALGGAAVVAGAVSAAGTHDATPGVSNAAPYALMALGAGTAGGGVYLVATAPSVTHQQSAGVLRLGGWF